MLDMQVYGEIHPLRKTAEDYAREMDEAEEMLAEIRRLREQAASHAEDNQRRAEIDAALRQAAHDQQEQERP